MTEILLWAGGVTINRRGAELKLGPEIPAKPEPL